MSRAADASGRYSHYLLGVAGQYAGQKLPVTSALTIGPDAAADVSLDDTEAGPVKVILQDGRLHIESLSGADIIHVNGQSVTSQALASGDEIRLGRQRFVVKMPGLRPDSVLRDLPPARRRSGWLLWAMVATATAIAAAAVYWYYVVR